MSHIARTDFVRVRSLIRTAADEGVLLSVQGDRLKYRAPEGQIPLGLRDEIVSLRQSVIAELSQPVFRERRERFTRLELPPCFDGFWHETRASQSLASSTHVILQLTGSLTLERLRRALADVVARHDLLSARFARGKRAPTLVFDAERAPAVEVADLSLQSPQARVRADALIERTVWAPFEDGPVFRACLIRLAAQEFLLAFVIHHIVGDYRSCEIIATELLARVTQANTASLPSNPRPIQFADYLMGLSEWLAGPAIPYRTAFWKQKMSGAPSVRLAPDSDGLSADSRRVELLQFSATAQLRARIAQAAADCKVPLFAALFAAQFGALWAKLRQRDLLIATVVSGREAPVLATLVGNTIDCVPVRMDVTAAMTLAELVRAVRDEDLLARSYHIPRTLLVEALQEVETVLVAPLFNFMIGSSPPSLEGSPIRVQLVPFKSPQRTAGTDWKGHELHLYDMATCLRGLVKFAPHCYRRATIASFVETMFDWLEAFAVRPQDTLAQWLSGPRATAQTIPGLEIS